MTFFEKEYSIRVELEPGGRLTLRSFSMPAAVLGRWYVDCVYEWLEVMEPGWLSLSRTILPFAQPQPSPAPFCGQRDFSLASQPIHLLCLDVEVLDATAGI